MLGFADKAEAHFNATDLLTAANAKITALETELATLKSASADFEAKITVLTGETATAQAALATKDTELKNVQAQLDAAQGKITKLSDVISGQGLSIDDLPVMDANDKGNTPKETAWAKYQRLMATNPREAGAFWASNSDEIIRTRAA